jgi:5-deoxy-glucuronate isomerase
VTGPIAAGSTGDGPWVLAVTPESVGWGYAGLRVAELPPGGSVEFALPADEALVVPLAGACTVECDAGSGRRAADADSQGGGRADTAPPAGDRGDDTATSGRGRADDIATSGRGQADDIATSGRGWAELAGRSSVFAGPTDTAYLPAGSAARLSTVDGGRFGVATTRANRRLPFRYLPAAGVPVELRGAGQCSRQVHNFGTPQVLDAVKLIACEVLTPGGNWSSYPPHKHDEERAGELPLEEIYYYEVAGGGMAYQRVYGTPERPIDVLAEVRTGDVVLVPHGWHGPSMAAPGYDLYYLNVMAGPAATRAWLICDDPAHAWVRASWRGQPVDPRLPMGRQ